MKQTKAEFLETLKGYIGESTDDAALALLENAADSFPDDSENWQQKYEQNDAEWRDKYKKRFFEKDKEPEDDEQEVKKNTFESLFKEG